MQYLISVIDDGTNIDTGKEGAAIDALNERLQAEGYWVFANGLSAPADATVVDTRSGETLITDGPYLESKEFLAGFWIWEADDLDVVLKLATEASTACNRKIEVRPMDGAAD